LDFYEAIASHYDQIIGASNLRQAVEGFVDSLLARHRVGSAMDAACGTGRYAIALASRGVRTTGVDISPAMLEEARKLSPAGVTVEWLASPMQALPRVGPFDLVLCMGNSLPHLLSDADLRATLEGFHRALAPGGLLGLHLLNYHRLLAGGERVVGIDRHGSTEYLRFYDFLPQAVRFNILQIDWAGPSASHRLHSTVLRPWTSAELSGAVTHAGLSDVELYGDLGQSSFDPRQSDTVLLLARKP
jgi:SAM-dependent methyltransferase